MSDPKPIAVIDGPLGRQEVSLYLGTEDELGEDLPWPDDWPEYVSCEFLRDHGYEVVIA